MMKELYISYLMGHYSVCNKNYLNSGIWWQLWKCFTNEFDVEIYFKEIKGFCIDMNCNVPISFDEFKKEFERVNK